MRYFPIFIFPRSHPGTSLQHVENTLSVAVPSQQGCVLICFLEKQLSWTNSWWGGDMMVAQIRNSLNHSHRTRCGPNISLKSPVWKNEEDAAHIRPDAESQTKSTQCRRCWLRSAVRPCVAVNSVIVNQTGIIIPDDIPFTAENPETLTCVLPITSFATQCILRL